MRTFKCGYSGGRRTGDDPEEQAGREFSDEATREGSKIVEVRLRHGRLIDSIQLVCEIPDGERHELPAHGGGGGQLSVFTLDRDEFLTGISGTYGASVDTIRLHTNKQTSAPFGGANTSGGPANYLYEAPEGYEIVGFWGRSGDMIDAIGIIFRQRPSAVK